MVDQELTIYLNKVEQETKVRTMEEWEQNQTTNPPLQHYNIKSTTDSNKQYKIKFSKKFNSYYCECPSWIYQNHNHKGRTCKHILAIRGEEAEKQRIQENGEPWFEKNQRYKKPKKKTEKNTKKKTYVEVVKTPKKKNKN